MANAVLEGKNIATEGEGATLEMAVIGDEFTPEMIEMVSTPPKDEEEDEEVVPAEELTEPISQPEV
jgi:hypothetical protein